jgi:hypothetical protein
MSAKEWCVEMSWGWSRLEVPKNDDDFGCMTASLRRKRVRTCGATTSEGYPVNVETRRLSCSRKALKEAQNNVVFALGPTTVDGTYELLDW